MKIIVSFLFLFTFCTLTYGFQIGDDWITFTSDEGNFSVLMPIQPEADSKTTNSPSGQYTTYLYTSFSGKSLYIAGWADYSFKVDTEGEIIANRDNLLKGLNAKLLTEKRITYEQYPGIEFTAELNSGQFLKSRVYLINNRPYQLIGAGDKVNEGNIDKFLSSFKLKRK